LAACWAIERSVAILRGERKLSKTHLRMLAEHFKVSTDLFIA
jgi:antitoxin component HigA of HigAB toxin-antitoxin module